MKRNPMFLFFTFLMWMFISSGAALADASGIVSDDFSAPSLDTNIWTFIDPLGDATLTMNGTNVLISVPAGTDHSITSSGINSPRIMQSADNTDFEIEVKYDSILNQKYQIQGIIIEQDSINYIRFDFYSNGMDTYIFAATFTDGIQTTRINQKISSGISLYMRIKREANQWTQSYSHDGQNWITSGSFTHLITVSSVGAFIGNEAASGGSAPAHTGSIDYFFNTSSPLATSPVIDIWYGTDQVFGQIGIPQAWVNILGNVSGRGGIASLSYSLNGGPELPLTIGPDGIRLQSYGDFNIEIAYSDLLCGPNHVDITATDNSANTTVETVNIQYNCGNIWPGSYSIDWSTVTDIQDVAQIVDGLWTLEADGIRPAVIGYDRLVTIGDITWDDYEITVPVTIYSLDSSRPNGGPLVAILVRWQGHYDWDGSQPRNGWWPIGAFGGYDWVSASGDYRLRIVGNNMGSIAEDISGRHLSVGTPYIFKMRVETVGSDSVYSLKVWEEGTPEPSAWDLTGTGLPGELKEGSLLLLAHQADVSFGNVEVNPGPFYLTINASVTGGNGSISCFPTIVEAGGNSTCTISPNTGYHLQLLTDNSENVTSYVTESTYVISNVTVDHTVVATFAINTYTVTPSAGANGSIDPSTPQTVNYGLTTSFTVTPDTGYHTESVTGCGGTWTGTNPYTTGPITDDCTVTATFAIDTYTVTPSVVGNGSIDPSTPQTVNHGSTTSFTVMPDTGYHTVSVTGCSGTWSGTNPYTTGPITDDCTVTATFAINTYTITGSAPGGHGAISCTSPVNYGETSTCTITPDTHYHLSALTDNSANVIGSVVNNQYTITNVTANHTVVATFAINTYTVTPSAGANGSIDPSTPQTVNYGLTTSFTVTPDTGYHTESVTGCGGTWTGTNPYTTGPITADCTVTATFAAYSKVTLIEPADGETISSGSTYTIHWEAPPEAKNFKVQYSMDNGLTWILIEKVSSVASCNWEVPKPLGNKKGCVVRVIGYDALNKEIGRDKAVALVIEVVGVTYPNGGETFAPGDSPTITWTTNATKRDVAKVKLYYTKDGGTTWFLIDKLTDPAYLIAGSHSYYDWTVPKVIGNKRQCKIRVELIDADGNVLGRDASDEYFTIEVVKLTSPNGGAGVTYTSGYYPLPITWTTNATRRDVARVRLFYTKDGGASWTKIVTLPEIPGDPVNPGSYDWTVPTVVIDRTKCKVKVELRDATGNVLGQDGSDDYFTIQKP